MDCRIEAKERVERNSDFSDNYLSNMFLLYQEIAGMTGTAKTEVGLRRFTNWSNDHSTNRPTLPVGIYPIWSLKPRRQGIAEGAQMHEAGRPVLLEPLVSKIRYLSKLLNQREIPYNAQRQTRERGAGVGIIAQAGRKGALTIATNMVRGQTSFWVEMPNTWRG